MNQYNSPPLKERFWSKVNKQGPLPSPEAVTAHPEIKGQRCWAWTASTQAKGYGQFKLNEGMKLAHRVAWLLVYGTWPKPCALHKCDNRSCVNTLHLFEGSIKDNAKDMVAKGRFTPPAKTGEHNGFSRLTEKQVIKIRKLSAQGWTQHALAERFNSAQTNISSILLRKTWRTL